MRMGALVAAAFLAACMFIHPAAYAQALPRAEVGATADQVPEQLRGIAVGQPLGERVPLSGAWTDASGRTVALADLVGERPALLVPVYYDCPMLCGMVLETLTQSLRTVSLEVGSDFDIVVFSFDPAEGPDLAAPVRTRILRGMDLDPAGDAGWYFLTGEEASIGELTGALGFTANFDQTSGEFAHAAGLYVLTPAGEISRVFFGLSYPPRDLKLALLEAGEGTIGTLADQVLLFCFRYDPATGRYSAAILKLVRLAGIATALALFAYLFWTWRRARSLEPDRLRGAA